MGFYWNCIDDLSYVRFWGLVGLGGRTCLVWGGILKKVKEPLGFDKKCQGSVFFAALASDKLFLRLL